MHVMPVSQEYGFSIMYVSRLAGVREGIAKKNTSHRGLHGG